MPDDRPVYSTIEMVRWLESRPFTLRRGENGHYDLITQEGDGHGPSLLATVQDYQKNVNKKKARALTKRAGVPHDGE